jgi:leader peptidase (prepilin peptidase) / N-methyltransferase
MIEIIILAVAAGLLLGSFLNVCVYRMPRDLSVVRPRSFCPHCERTIVWYDNLPLLSFVLLRGRCRACGNRIPLRYPLLELATGLAFAGWVAHFGLTPAALKFSVFSAILLALTASDFEERILPDEFTLGGLALGLVFAVFVPVDSFFISFFLPPSLRSIGESAFAAVFAAGSIWFVGWAYEKIRHREGMGFGDVKMIAMIGAFLGIRWALLTMIGGSLAGSVLGLIYVGVTRKDASTYELPFGTFLGAAALLAAVLSQWSTG